MTVGYHIQAHSLAGGQVTLCSIFILSSQLCVVLNLPLFSILRIDNIEYTAHLDNKR